MRNDSISSVCRQRKTSTSPEVMTQFNTPLNCKLNMNFGAVLMLIWSTLLFGLTAVVNTDVLLHPFLNIERCSLGSIIPRFRSYGYIKICLYEMK